MNTPKHDYSVYLVTEPYLEDQHNNYFTKLEQALKGGVSVLQFREKIANRRKMLELAAECQKLARRYKIPYIINDQVDLALILDAEGVHVGQEDLPAKEVRQLIGPDKCLGVSVSTLEEAIQAEKDGADYLGVGSMYRTATKPDAVYTTIDAFKQIREAVSIPLVTIGGITAENLPELKEIGADGYAIISAILQTDDPFSAARQMKELAAKE